MKSTDLLARCENLTHRKLDYWCHNGIFTERHEGDRRTQRRDFTEEDLRVARVLSRVSHAFDAWSNGRGGLVAIYREIADQIRAGSETSHVVLAPGVDIYVTVDQPIEPSPSAPEEPAEEIGFVPGVGADNG